jgi:hypothetical protein
MGLNHFTKKKESDVGVAQANEYGQSLKVNNKTSYMKVGKSERMTAYFHYYR